MGPPLSFTWGDLVDRLADERGSLSALARALQLAAPPSAKLSADVSTIERGLRRLRGRGILESDKYGRLLLRVFGMPETVSAWAMRLGKYHSALSDLPVPLRRDQLRLWDRPPVNETPLAAWIHIGLASVARRSRQPEEVRRRLDLAGLVAHRAGPEAQLERLLFEAWLSKDPDDFLDHAEEHLDDPILPPPERANYFARLQDQRAYRAFRHGGGLDAARTLYASIPADGAPLFAAFRRAHGLAWCALRSGEQDAAVALAREAAEHAGDAGLVRMRWMAITMEAHAWKDRPQADVLWVRAKRIAQALEDPDLLSRIPKQHR
ncbi:MAG: hypothetical protein AAFV53_09020 [Myxococcota bacterium]